MAPSKRSHSKKQKVDEEKVAGPFERCGERVVVVESNLAEEESLEVVPVSRMRSGRGIHASQIPGDIVLRILKDGLKVETVLCGRKWSLDLPREKLRAINCGFWHRDQDFDYVECCVCSIRLGCERHRNMHVARSHPGAPSPCDDDEQDSEADEEEEEESRIRLECQNAFWLKETGGILKIHTVVSTFERDHTKDPLFGEVERTNIICLRLRHDKLRNDHHLKDKLDAILEDDQDEEDNL